MAIQTITYTNKVTLNENPSVADINKVKADDMNEIKSVVNANANLQGDLSGLNTADKSSLVAALNSINTYSTTEKVIGKWIDDNNFYRKTITTNLGSTVNSFNKIADLTFDKVISINGVLISDEGDSYPIPRSYNNEEITLYANKTNSCVYESHDYSWASGKTVILNVFYTKA